MADKCPRCKKLVQDGDKHFKSYCECSLEELAAWKESERMARRYMEAETAEAKYLLLSEASLEQLLLWVENHGNMTGQTLVAEIRSLQNELSVERARKEFAYTAHSLLAVQFAHVVTLDDDYVDKRITGATLIEEIGSRVELCEAFDLINPGVRCHLEKGHDGDHEC